MDLPKSSQIAKDLRFVSETGSTNSDLVSGASKNQDFTVLVAGFQSAGRGRAGREWLAPKGSSLFVSVLLKPLNVSTTSYSWLPLLAGLAMTKTVAEFIPNSPMQKSKISLKWPNDVLVGERKIAGVLSELLPKADGVVIGAGLNLLQTQSELPIQSATSLALEGGQNIELDEVLASYLKNLHTLYKRWESSAGDADDCGLRNQVIAVCSTLKRSENRMVRAIMPGEIELTGSAVDIDKTGRLILQPSGESQVVAVAAGDIVHLRHN